MELLSMQRHNISFYFLNMGHFIDHYFMLIFASVAALRLTQEWGMSYSELIPYATPGFIAFGVCAIPAGWIADKWSREGMMLIFFLGIGASAILTGFADSPVDIAISLTLVGVFAAIYHPVGLAMVVQGRTTTGMPLAINGVFGNMGVASAALITGLLIDTAGWRAAFVVSGVLSIIIGVCYHVFLHSSAEPSDVKSERKSETREQAETFIPPTKQQLRTIFAIIFFTTAMHLWSSQWRRLRN